MSAPAYNFRQLPDFMETRSPGIPTERINRVRKAARGFREKMLSGPQVIYYKTFDLIRIPYPTRYGLFNTGIATPFMHILNRLYVIQFKTEDKIKTLLFSPSDIYANRETPFFKRLTGSLGPFKRIGEKFLAIEIGTVESCLASTGIKPEQVDFISYDHLHTQDLRKWLGTTTRKAYFPNAKLLVMKQEWDSVHGLLPPQADWYCPGGVNISPEKVILLDGDISPGDGVALLKTTGHTIGNHSLVAHTPHGLFVSSENGVSADSYSPLNSKIPAVRKYARAAGMEVILNGNTQESGLEQYISMVQEKEIAGPNNKNPDFYNVVPSSELVEYWGFPGLKPTFSFGPLEFGIPYIQE